MSKTKTPTTPSQKLALTDYQIRALSTAIYPEDQGLAYTALGLAGEAGEVADKVKKLLRDHGGKLGSQQLREGLARELGDVLWYVAAVAHELGYDLEEIAWINLDKLALRHQNGTIQGEGDHR